ncbi:glycosyltransferase [Variovorax robiniae]|uniref:Glycosyltransferase n=1 Tax=Variovorax robiniae TaxID=1836199 RepID=A0ABU8XK72_9BURK
MAKVLLTSAKRHHPEATFYLCLADKISSERAFYPDNVEIVLAEDLDIPDFKSFAFRYDVMEFNTALKPFMFRHLLEKEHRSVIYFDPDIEVFRRLEEVCSLLDEGASFVLTPHLTRPAERDMYPDDVGIMRAGIYNLGFLAVGASHETNHILRWWSRRLMYQCINDQASGIFVDQKFMDLIPGFADGAKILRDASYNVAYWNLHQRALDGFNGEWTVNGRPLCFFHFSGISLTDTNRLSKHSAAFRGTEIGAPLRSLLTHYRSQLLANGFGNYPDGDYAFGRFASGAHIPTLIRHMFRETHLLWIGDPFETYEEFLHLPHVHGFGSPDASITNLMNYMHERTSWLQAAFPRSGHASAKAFQDWYIKHGHTLVKDRRLVEPVALQAARVSPAAALRRPPPSRRSESEADVSVVGYLRLALGVGEVGRQILGALRDVGVNARGLPVNLNSHSQVIDTSSLEHTFADLADGRIQIFNVNADQLPQVVNDLAPRLRSDAYRVVMPFWELEEFPGAWLSAFDLVDEVWAPTRFIQAMLAPKLTKPVLHMPLPLSFDKPTSVDRCKFDLPADAFIFFFAFDFLSYAERKNPMGLMRAYKRAFNQQERANVKLVIKALNADRVPRHGQDMRDRLRADPDVILIEGTLNRADMLELIAASDAVVSLHRSEGLGLLVAEAMALGKPVISTDYSATTELVSHDTGWPVDFTMLAVKPDEYVFSEGQVWAQPDETHAASQMRRVRDDREEALRRAAVAQTFLEKEYSFAACSNRLARRIDEVVGSRPLS